MTNVNGPFGFRPLRHLNGGHVVTRPFSIAADYSTPIYKGDVVELTGTGTNIQVAAAQNTDNLGVFQGVRYVNAQGEQKFSRYWTGETGCTDIVALVIDDPNVIYLVQCDSLAEGTVGQLADWDAGAGNTATGLSGRSLVTSTGTGTTGGSIAVMRLHNRVNNAYGAYALAEVMFAEAVRARVVSGVGGI